jgi:hypothetical protein
MRPFIYHAVQDGIGSYLGRKPLYNIRAYSAVVIISTNNEVFLYKIAGKAVRGD